MFEISWGVSKLLGITRNWALSAKFREANHSRLNLVVPTRLTLVNILFSLFAREAFAIAAAVCSANSPVGQDGVSQTKPQMRVECVV